jgi:hypothetical protein
MNNFGLVLEDLLSRSDTKLLLLNLNTLAES